MRWSFYLIALTMLAFSCAVKKDTYTKEIEEYRKAYDQSKMKDDRMPFKTQKDLKSIQYFEPKAKYLVSCVFDSDTDSSDVEVMTYSGLKREFYKRGTATCQIDKLDFKLTLLKSSAPAALPEMRKNIFLAFKDLTSGNQSYGGGRYINLSEDDIKDGLITIDFNKAYNPLCAYGDGFNCPIPPSENFIPIELLAGEKNFIKP
jgi:uncharacterized protein